MFCWSGSKPVMISFRFFIGRVDAFCGGPPAARAPLVVVVIGRAAMVTGYSSDGAEFPARRSEVLRRRGQTCDFSEPSWPPFSRFVSRDWA